ncbi:hypothetical protein M2272_001004 [Mycobacterium frederiksbergense]|uniref:ESX-1 secretion-associated protein n=1 Tax=Mycolicibacterium frederiksbergense TaxID=117567 RepID=A0ABT6KUK6_9MYCO|nr:type VII secretion target [Mycolicibacterium frederiksbergense]MDH6194383.1 hypothetical protein [Mycolicibacterium frederiksbergense]
MGEPLRVIPEALHQAAASEQESAAAISGLAVGQSFTAGASGMTGLSSGAACSAVGSAFDDASKAVSTDLDAHSGKLSTAAVRYQQVDQQYAMRIHGMTG